MSLSSIFRNFGALVHIYKGEANMAGSSCVVMWLYYRHLEIYGPKSHSARMRRMEDKTITDSPSIA